MATMTTRESLKNLNLTELRNLALITWPIDSTLETIIDLTPDALRRLLVLAKAVR